MNRWPASPSVLVEGWRVLRAMTMAVEFEALPPGCAMPPEKVGSKPMRLARNFVVYFSISVRTGEHW